MTRSPRSTWSSPRTSSWHWRRTTSRTTPPGSEPHPVTPASRLLFWIRAAFVGDAVLAAAGGLLIARGQEGAGYGLLIFTAVRATIGVFALLLAHRSLERRDPHDDEPSVFP